MKSSITFKVLSKDDALLFDQVEMHWKNFYVGMQNEGLQLPLIPGGEHIWRRGIESSLGRTNRLIVAILDESVIGFAWGSLRMSPEYLGSALIGFVNAIFIIPNQRRSGLGTQLYSALEAWFEERKATTYELQVVKDNVGGIRFWEDLDYEGELFQMRKKPGKKS